MSQRTLKGLAEQPASKLPLDRLLDAAIATGAGMIHIEPTGTGARLRLRSHLELRQYSTISREDYAVLWQNIVDRFGTEHLEPFFESSFPFTHERGTRLIRVSLMPTPQGEAITLKVNARQEDTCPLERLGIGALDLVRVQTQLAKPWGLVVMAGASGAGTTTTLLSLLGFLNDGTRKMLSIEDPIDVHLEGIQQIQVKVMREFPERSVTYERVLRAAALQNPDVIAIGQIRDGETASTALQAALSGALVLSRIHAPAAALAVSALLKLGTDPFTLADCLRTVLAQRLARRNCAACREPEALEERAQKLGRDLAEFAGHARVGRGCQQCRGLGCVGLMPAFELLPTEGEIPTLIAEKRTAAQIQARAVEEGMTPLAATVRAGVLAGEVPIDEYLRWL
jgi:general secretion pathway protein E